MSNDPTTLSAQVKQLNIGDDSSTTDSGSSELVAVVDDLLNQLSGKFSNLSSELIGKSGTSCLDNSMQT
ncbi:hypothetical protein LTR78_000601 [Recurvomyces mirabilis]|uniref:Uncharacterized protein n=1 Tax=Recurvomyces mirabilis TaxID=574656 RepID=A0AAE1C6S1_9PEZI|nr:hypothetical protein LTR78_000601 [Recurvomyces mirabilis]KAK5162255.1 hypothetical protein LTS14_000602 [Recurvomyces mirabilis]